MGVLLSLPLTLLNFLLPFTNANTPLVQDLVHTAVLCGTLYFAPQIAEWYAAQQQAHMDGTEEQIQDHDNNDNHVPHEPFEIGREPDDPPIDERLVLQPDDEEPTDPPPLAPTPPPPAIPQHQAHIEDDDDDDFLHARNNHNNNNGDINNNFPGQPGPAHDRPRATPANRTVGAKKAKSLARKDQRRAYHEFHRQEAELRRLQEAEGAEERTAALTAERERRARIEDEIREKEREEREKIKKEREREAELEAQRRERCLESVRTQILAEGAVDLVEEAWKEGKDKIWIEKLVRASGLLAQLQRDGEERSQHIMITGHGWLVKVDDEVVQRAYEEAEAFGRKNTGRIGFADFGGMLEKAVLARTRV